MSVNRKFVIAPEPAKPEPIQYLTENGFSIIRRCDVDDSLSKGGLDHCFVVRDPDGYEIDITVRFAANAVAEAILHSYGRLTFASSYWLVVAERHLSDYLGEHNDYPPDEGVIVDQLTPIDVELAQRWVGEPS